MGSGGDDNAVTAESFDVDNNSLQQFVGTAQGAKYKDSVGPGLHSFQKYSNGQYSAYDSRNRGLDTTSLINDYNAWLATQKDYGDERQRYLDLASQEQGRDATILTAPNMNATAPGLTALGQPPKQIRY